MHLVSGNHAQTNKQTLRTREKLIACKVATKVRSLQGVRMGRKRRGRESYRVVTKVTNPVHKSKHVVKQPESERST